MDHKIIFKAKAQRRQAELENTKGISWQMYMILVVFRILAQIPDNTSCLFRIGRIFLFSRERQGNLEARSFPFPSPSPSLSTQIHPSWASIIPRALLNSIPRPACRRVKQDAILSSGNRTYVLSLILFYFPPSDSIVHHNS